MQTLDLSQATAAAQAGGLLSANLRADGDHFLIEFETRAGGPAVLATSNRRRPRAFRNPLRALEVIRALGLQTGRFSLEGWRPETAPANKPARPDRAAALRQAHAQAAAYEKWVRAQVQEALDDHTPALAHDEVKAAVQARIEALRKAKRDA